MDHTTRTVFSLHSAGQLYFGRRAVHHLAEISRRSRSKRTFVVTDKNLIQAGLMDEVRAALSEAGVLVSIFDGGEPEPTLETVLRCVRAARHFEPDTLVGLGGGSNMDTAKIASIILRHGGEPRDYVGEDRVPGPVLPVICVPTTAGTGSEVSHAAVFTDTEKQLKVSCLSQYLRPFAAVVDPLLTISCPPKVTADSGIDALTHAVEALTAVDNTHYPVPQYERSVYQGKNPFGDMFAEKAIALIGRFLRRAVHNSTDLEAREGMALASTLAGLAFSNAGVALVHAMEYPVGAAVHCSHGAGNGLLLPFVMRYNLAHRIPVFAEIAHLLGEDLTGLTQHQAAEHAVVAVEKLKADIGIPGKLSELGATESQLSGFAEKAFSIKRLMRVNPRFPTQEEIEAIYREAL
jgi:alcohol dehydrogenase class IV